MNELCLCKERSIFYPLVHFSYGLEKQDWVLKNHPRLLHECSGLNTWAIFSCFSNCISRELDQKGNSQDLAL